MWKPDLWAPVRELARCHVTSQFGARRNALLACTALAQRRRERDDVEQFLATTKRLGSVVPETPDGRTSMSICSQSSVLLSAGVSENGTAHILSACP